MSTWEKVRLGDVFTLQMGKTPAREKNEYWNNGENPWISIADLSTYDKYVAGTKETISNLGVSKSGIKSVPTNTVIMSFKLSLGKTAITQKEIFTNEAIMGFIPNGNRKIDADYIYHLFSNMDWTKGTNRAVMGSTLNKATLKTIEIPLPPLAEQKRIAEILDTASGLIKKRKEQIRLIDQLAKSLFVEMFGDPVENPMGWDKIPLGKRCYIVTGNTPSRAESENYGSYVEWIKSDNINTPFSTLTPAKEYLSELGFSRGRFVEGNSVLMTCIAGSISCIGNCAIANRRVAFNQQINAIIPKVESVWYLYYLFTLSKLQIQSTINMSLKGILSKGQLAKLEFIFPPPSLQQKFADRIDAIEKQKALFETGLEKLEMNYRALMQEYFG